MKHNRKNTINTTERTRLGLVLPSECIASGSRKTGLPDIKRPYDLTRITVFLNLNARYTFFWLIFQKISIPLIAEYREEREVVRSNHKKSLQRTKTTGG